jgi:hypothetical protein
MLHAFRGRSAAYLALKDPERALSDLTTLVLLLEQDLATQRKLNTGDLTEALQQTAKAHRERGTVLMDRGRRSAAVTDFDRAEELEKQTAGKPNTTRKPNAWIRVVNEWTRTATVEIDGEVYVLAPNEEKKWRRAPGTFTYTVREQGIPRTSGVKDGEMTVIRIYPPKQ